MPETRKTTEEAIAALTEKLQEVVSENEQLRLGLRETDEKVRSQQQINEQLRLQLESKSIRDAVPVSFDPKVVELLPTFSGKESEDITVFVKSIRDVAQWYSWSDGTALQVIKLRLTGEARTYVMYHEVLSKVQTFCEFCEGLYQRYRKQNSARFFREKLSNLYLKRNETVEVFSDRIRKLNAQTYELTDSEEANRVLLAEAENRALDVFLKGLPSEMSRKVRVEDPKTLMEALRIATRLEEVEVATRQKGDNRMFVSQLKCFRCGKLGHKRKACRVPQCFRCGMVGHNAQRCNVERKSGTGVNKKSLNGKGIVSSVERPSQ